MQIKFHNIRDQRDHHTCGEISFDEAEKVRGDLEIVFEDDTCERFERADVSVPLVVSETKLFFARLRMHGHATWKIYFAPFLDAALDEDCVKLMTGSNDHLSGDIVEVLPARNLSEIEARLDDLESRYGQLLPSENAIESPS